MLSEEQKIKIRFDGQLHQVDAQTFINSLINFSEVIKQVNIELDQERKIEIKITALEKGSFIAELSLQAINLADRLFDGGNVSYVSDMIGIVAGVYGLKKVLGGKSDKEVRREGSSVLIEDNHGTVQIFDNRTYDIYLKNQSISDAVANNFASLEEDPSVSGFEIIKNDTPIFSAQKEDFSTMATKVEVEDSKKKSSTVSANLIIHKLIFEKNNRKWEFYYNGNKISANVEDEDFFKEIDGGKAFAKGDQLRVDLKINQIYEPSVDAYVNHSYQVIKVQEHVPRLKPKQLPFMEDDIV